MQGEIIRVEPLSTWLERWGAPISAVVRGGDTIYVSGLPPFDPTTGEVVDAPLERQTEIVLEQMKLCLETAGSSLDKALKCTVYCTSVDHYAAVNAINARYLTKHPPARVFVCVPVWPGRFDIEIDCLAAVEQMREERTPCSRSSSRSARRPISGTPISALPGCSGPSWSRWMASSTTSAIAA